MLDRQNIKSCSSRALPAKIVAKQCLERSGAILDISTYVNAKTKALYNCSTNKSHAEWWAKPNNIKNGRGCPTCGQQTRLDKARLDVTEVAERVLKCSTYKLVQSTYICANRKAEFICEKHGHFEAIVSQVFYGTGCVKCRYEKAANTHSITSGHTVKAYRKKFAELPVKLLVSTFAGGYRLATFKCLNGHPNFKAKPALIANGTSSCQICNRLLNTTSGYRRKCKRISGRLFNLQGYEPLAIRWMLKHRNVKVQDIVVGLSMPTFRYMLSGEHRYFPDFYLPKNNRIIEVKSTYTLYGTDAILSKNVSKAKAVIKAGFKFTLLLFNKGKRVKLPENWYSLTRSQLQNVVKQEIFFTTQ